NSPATRRRKPRPRRPASRSRRGAGIISETCYGHSSHSAFSTSSHLWGVCFHRTENIDALPQAERKDCTSLNTLKKRRPLLGTSSFLVLLLVAPAAFADPPGKPGAGAQKFTSGRYVPEPGAIVYKIPGDPGFHAPRTKYEKTVRSWQELVDDIKRHPDKSV